MNLRSSIIIAVFCAAIFRVFPASAELFVFPAQQNTGPGDPEQNLLSESRTVVIYGSADIEASGVASVNVYIKSHQNNRYFDGLAFT